MNKIRVFSAAFIAAMTLGLASCDVEMNLSQADRDVEIVNNTNIFANNLGELYDKVVVSGDSNSEKILNNVLYAYAKTLFGDFIADYDGTGALKAGVKPAAFVKEDGTVDTVKSKDFFNSIKKSVMKSFWGVVTNSSYQKNKFFKEELFVKAMKNELYSFNETGVEYAVTQIVGDTTYENALEYFHGENFEEFRTFYADYIERSLLPAAYRKALVEQYLIDQNYGTLGRSYARKVQYVALPALDKYEDSTRALVRAYCNLVLSKTDAELGGAEVAAKLKNLGFLNSLYQGVVTDGATASVANAIYTAAGFTTIEGTSFYKETAFGQLYLDYQLLTDSRWETGTTTDFTNGGAYSAATGFEMKTRDIVATSRTTSGWYTSSGLSDLPSSMKTRLFKTQVANEVDDPTNPTDPTVLVAGKYTWRVQGEYYLRPETIQTGEQFPYAMYDDSSKTWYIVRVDEAVKSAKLSADGDDSSTSYAKRPADGSQGETLNQIVWDVADLIADGDSYKKAARQYYVDQMGLSFHDDTVYNYFKVTFPDLFE